MEYRVEKKYLVTDAELAILHGRLKAIMPLDVHQIGDCYEIRSLYFDDARDRCMDENESGVDQRQKYRIRIYDPSAQLIHLEIKEKTSGLTRKYSCDMSKDEVDQILENTCSIELGNRKPLNKLLMQMKLTRMVPKVIIAYERTAFVYPEGNVRITFDRNIMASRACDEFFEERFSGAVPVLPAGIHILEVKYDEFLPDFIANQLEIRTLRQTAFSKYYLGRLAVQGEFPVDR